MAIATDRRRILRLITERLASQLGADVLVLAPAENTYARSTQQRFVKVLALSTAHVGRYPSPNAAALDRITLTVNCMVTNDVTAADAFALETLVSQTVAALRQWTSADVATTGHVLHMEEATSISQADQDEERGTVSAGVTFTGQVQRASGTTFESP